MAQINEGTKYEFNVRPLNAQGNAYTPTTGRYKMTDKDTSTEMLAWTSFGTLSTSMDEEISGLLNTIINSAKPSETKVITIELDWSTPDQSTTEHEYEVINLQFRP